MIRRHDDLCPGFRHIGEALARARLGQHSTDSLIGQSSLTSERDDGFHEGKAATHRR
jgi:hypothetical protein